MAKITKKSEHAMIDVIEDTSRRIWLVAIGNDQTPAQEAVVNACEQVLALATLAMAFVKPIDHIGHRALMINRAVEQVSRELGAARVLTEVEPPREIARWASRIAINIGQAVVDAHRA